MLFVACLWPFNFSEKNNAAVNPVGGLEIARYGTAFTVSPASKLKDLQQLTIYIDLEPSSDGLNSFGKIVGNFMSQEEMNFFLGQWRDGLILHLRTDRQIKAIKLGSEDVLKRGERTRCMIAYDGRKLSLYQDGKLKRYRETGPLLFSNWDGTYPLAVGTDANGRSQWRGTIYEIAVVDRAMTSDEAKRLPGPSSLSGHPPLSPFTKGGPGNEKIDYKPLIHYVFKPENTYETEFKGRKAMGVRDLGKGEPADLVIPERFAPYERVYLGWDPDWMNNSSDRLDVVVNLLGFMPFGFLLSLQLIAGKAGKGGEAESIQPMETRRGIVVAVILTVVTGFVVSFAVEYLQAYLPSRDSSLRDLVCNTVGTLAGALAAVLLVGRTRDR